VHERGSSGEEQRAGPRGPGARPAGSGSGESASDLKQLLQGLLVAAISVGMLTGGLLLSQLESPTGEPPTPTQEIAQRPTGTPFLPAFTAQPSTAAPGTQEIPTSTPTEEEWTVVVTPEETATMTAVLDEEPTATTMPTLGPRQSPSPFPVCVRPPGWFIYTVRRGDTLAGLAAQAGVAVQDLVQANCLTTSALMAGDHIYLPGAFFATPTPWHDPCGPPMTWLVYYVEPGDTLYSLSRRFNVPVETIRWANCLPGYQIYAGQLLFLPPLPPTPWPSATATQAPTSTTPPTAVTTPPTAPSTPSSTPETPVPTSTPTSTFTPAPTSTSSPTTAPTATWTPTTAPSPTSTSAPTSTPTDSSSPTPTSTPG